MGRKAVPTAELTAAVCRLQTPLVPEGENVICFFKNLVFCPSGKKHMWIVCGSSVFLTEEGHGSVDWEGGVC